MPIQLSDATVGTQRLAISNAIQVELGSATPVAPLSVNGNVVFDGTQLGSSTVPSNALQRTAGSVYCDGSTLSVTVSLPAQCNFGVVDGNGAIYEMSSSSFTFGTQTPFTAATYNYAVI
jgi:hypothetical protein